MPLGIGQGEFHQADVLGQQRGHQRKHGQRGHVSGHPHGHQPLRLGRQIVPALGNKTVEIGRIAVKIQLQKLAEIAAAQPGRKKHRSLPDDAVRGSRINRRGKVVEQRHQAIDRNVGQPIAPASIAATRPAAARQSPAGSTPRGVMRSTLIGFPLLGRRYRRSRGFRPARYGW